MARSNIIPGIWLLQRRRRPKTKRQVNNMSEIKRILNKRRSSELMPRVLMLPLLLLSLAGCSNSSPQSESSSSIIPELSPLAIQPQVPEFCLQTCSANLSKEIDSWQNMLTQQEKQD